MSEELLDKVIFKGFNDVICCEAGGPRPGIGCAGRGVLVAIQLLEDYNILEKYDISFAIYDVLGDVVCGGFAQPMRAGNAKEIYLVTCGEPLTLYITNEIFKAVRRINGEGVDVGVAGLIDNQRMIAHEQEIVEAFAEQVGVPVIEHVPRSVKVQEAEAEGKTVMEAFPDSDQAEVYRGLARKVLDNKHVYLPDPMSGMDEILQLAKEFISK
jgi:nitrogenase iron protein NifH